MDAWAFLTTLISRYMNLILTLGFLQLVIRYRTRSRSWQWLVQCIRCHSKRMGHDCYNTWKDCRSCILRFLRISDTATVIIVLERIVEARPLYPCMRDCPEHRLWTKTVRQVIVFVCCSVWMDWRVFFGSQGMKFTRNLDNMVFERYNFKVVLFHDLPLFSGPFLSLML